MDCPRNLNCLQCQCLYHYMVTNSLYWLYYYFCILFLFSTPQSSNGCFTDSVNGLLPAHFSHHYYNIFSFLVIMVSPFFFLRCHTIYNVPYIMYTIYNVHILHGLICLRLHISKSSNQLFVHSHFCNRCYLDCPRNLNFLMPMLVSIYWVFKDYESTKISDLYI